jgi:hypothetical protein
MPAVLVKHLQDHPAILRFVVVVVEDHRLKARTGEDLHHNGGAGPAHIPRRGEGTAGGQLGGVFVGILVERYRLNVTVER